MIKRENRFFVLLRNFYCMIYPQNLEEKIGFNKVRNAIKERCLSALGKLWVDELTFLTEHAKIAEELAATAEYMHIENSDESFPLGSFSDVQQPVSRLKAGGTWMESLYFLELAKTLKTIHDVVLFFKNREEDNYPVLKNKSIDVPIFPQHIRAIHRIVDEHGEVKDSASPELRDIRQKLWKEQKGISRKLEQILASAKKDGLVETSVSPTVRDGRLVIPVAARFKRQLNGIVHDESASGKTAFIEPAQVVEANNKIREFEHQEKREIIRILTILSNELRPDIEGVLDSLVFIGYIDFVRAKARYARDGGAICPVVDDTREFDWEQAQHPILKQTLEKEGKKVVPLNVKLNQTDRILLISGPNAGGKSVCLKTVGLLQYMIQCGIPVPVDERSKFGVFKHIFIDIGDEQSLENDLSTYSSHLMNMKFFLKNADEKTLLLVDEFGTGTEPHLGGAIAEAILNALNQNGAYGVFTTHYSNLKHMASSTEGLVNGAMLYDQNKMEPLFSLQIGKPGSSFAIEIARKIGLPVQVIDEASEKVGKEHVDFDKHLREINRDKRYWEQKRDNIRRKNKRVEELSETFEQELSDLKKKHKTIVKEAKDEAAALLKEANKTIERTIREIKEAAAEKEKTKQIRKTFEEVKEQLITSKEQQIIDRKMLKLLERGQQQRASTKETAKERKKPERRKEKKQEQDQNIQVGDVVKLLENGSFGEVLEISNQKVVVALGQFQTTQRLSKVQKVSNRQRKKETKGTHQINAGLTDEMREKKLNFKESIDIRGQRVDEAMTTVTHFIDNAIMCGARHLKILHGTGTGALRQQVRQYLDTVDFVISAKDEHVQFGGAGITVVELAY